MSQLNLTFSEDPPEPADVEPVTINENTCWLPGVDLPVKLPQAHASYQERAKQLKKIIDEIWQLTHDRHAFDKCCELWLTTLRRFEPGAQEREERYLEIVDEWGREAVEQAVRGFALLNTHFRDDGAFYDLLGQTYELCADDWGGQVLGQYFTPWALARGMARSTLDGVEHRLEAGETVSVHDCACGSGVMLLAAKSVVAKRCGRRALRQLRCYGQDIDGICCTMAQIQSRMTNIPWLLNLNLATFAEANNANR